MKLYSRHHGNLLRNLNLTVYYDWHLRKNYYFCKKNKTMELFEYAWIPNFYDQIKELKGIAMR